MVHNKLSGRGRDRLIEHDIRALKEGSNVGEILETAPFAARLCEVAREIDLASEAPRTPFQGVHMNDVNWGTTACMHQDARRTELERPL